MEDAPEDIEHKVGPWPLTDPAQVVPVSVELEKDLSALAEDAPEDIEHKGGAVAPNRSGSSSSCLRRPREGFIDSDGEHVTAWFES